VYDHVFFALNPPFRVPWVDGLPDQFKVSEDGIDYLRPCPELWDVEGVDLDKLIRETGEASTWSKQHQRLAPTVPFARFAKSYWLRTLAYVEQCDPIVVEAMEADLDSCWFWPDDNELPLIMAKKIGAYFNAIGCDAVAAYDEFRIDGPKPFSTNELSNPVIDLTVGCYPTAIGCLHAHFHGAVMIWSYQNSTTTIGLTDAAFSRADPEDFFECIRATPDMKPDWLRQLEEHDAAR
jgi:hypothetical protein